MGIPGPLLNSWSNMQAEEVGRLNTPASAPQLVNPLDSAKPVEASKTLEMERDASQSRAIDQEKENLRYQVHPAAAILMLLSDVKSNLVKCPVMVPPTKSLR